jgi:hypothetical protein
MPEVERAVRTGAGSPHFEKNEIPFSFKFTERRGQR